MTLTDHIEIDPSVMTGKPVILGTRIPLELIFRKLEEGSTETDLLDAYPGLTPEDLRSARDLLDICRRFKVAGLAVFGSALRQDFRPDSDIDLLVDFESNARIGLLTLSRLRRELERHFERRVDLVPRGSVKPTLRQAIEDRAKVLYAA
jgi:uncharacterized protein